MRDFRHAVNRYARYDYKHQSDENADEKTRREWVRKQGLLWFHADPEPALRADPLFGADLPDPKIKSVDKETLADVAARYVQRPWLQDEWFEWMTLDALLNAEIVAFAVDWKDRAGQAPGYPWDSSVKHKGNLQAMRAEAVRRQLVGKLVDRAIAFVLPVVAITKAESYSWWYCLAVAWLGLNVVSRPILWTWRAFKYPRPRGWEKGWVLWEDMRRMYNRLPRDAVVAPSEIRKELEELAKHGAV